MEDEFTPFVIHSTPLTAVSLMLMEAAGDCISSLAIKSLVLWRTTGSGAGYPGRVGRFHPELRQSHVVSIGRSRRLRQLSCHARSIQSLGTGQPQIRSRLQ